MDFSPEQIKFFNKLENYYKSLGEVMSPRIKDCGACIDCCAYLVSTIPSPLEIDYARYYLIKNKNPHNLPILTWNDYLERSGGLCIYIDPEKKSCTLYQARFNICRIYGPYIPDTDITMYADCVYKGHSVPRCYQAGLVPYRDEFKYLVEGYLKLLPSSVVKTYKDITSFGKTASKRLEHTKERYEKLIKQHPSIADFYFWLGRVCIALGKWQEGLVALEKSISLNPGQVESYLDIGSFFYQKGDMENARKAFREALKNSPGDSQSRYPLILSYIKQKRLKEAAEEFSILLEDSLKYEEKVTKEKEMIYVLADDC